MSDQQSAGKLEVLLTQVKETGQTLAALDAEKKLLDSSPAFRQVNTLISRARPALADNPMQDLLPALVTPPAGWRAVHASELVMAMSSLEAVLEACVLGGKIAQPDVGLAAIVDDELRDRCLDLLTREGKTDTAISAACVVLEDRIRRSAGLTPEDIGVGLVDKALGPDHGILEFDVPSAELKGIHGLYRGVIAVFKNPTSHRVVPDYDATRGGQVIGLVDLLLQMLGKAKKRRSKAEGARPTRRL